MKIFRFQPFGATTIESLCTDQLHFSDPTAFNDPLDCQPTVESDSDQDTLRQILSHLVKRRAEAETLASLKNAKLEGEKTRVHARRQGEQRAQDVLRNIAYNATNPDYGESEEDAERWILTIEIEKELLKQYDRGVCCFSAAMDNPLLWSHYGDQHRGICVGYDTNRDPKPVLHKVEYGGSRIVSTSLIASALLGRDPEARDSLDRKVLLRKASPWRYEREWRLFGNRGVQDSALALKDVTFGLRCPGAIMYAVIAALESREGGVKFFEMCDVRKDFKLKRRALCTEEMHVSYPRTARSGEEIFGPLLED